jgi:hypothetical protein
MLLALERDIASIRKAFNVVFMGKQFSSINEEHRLFIEAQKVFFVATADRFGRINLSPKGLDSLRVTGPNEVVWLNLTGSGNETSPHIFNQNRMTLMFCSFDEKPLILRLYGKAVDFHGKEPEWESLLALFPNYTGTRQIFRLSVDLVQTSCGYGVPRYDYVGQRSDLTDWADSLGPEGIRRYWKEKNQLTIDGVGTRINYLKGL